MSHSSNSSRNRLADWFGAHAHALTTLDPDAALDELEPVREIIGDARVVALGEGCHFVHEFTRARQRLLRFLAQRCGFSVLAFEFGFAESFPLDRWLRGTGEDAALSGLQGTTNAGLNSVLAHWLREHNRTSAHPLRFAGVDVPVAGGQLRPALEPFAAYVRQVDPETVPLVDHALEIADRFTGNSMAVAAPGWAELSTAEQDALTATLARLLVRCRALEPLYVSRSDQWRYDTNRRLLEAACHTDHVIRALQQLIFGEDGLPADISVRDFYMAETLRWHLDRLEPGTRVVLAAHNNHIQKTPVHAGTQLMSLPMGHYLARTLGTDYRALALTHTAGRVPEMTPDGSPDTGFSLADTALEAPAAGSPEAALMDAGLGEVVTVTNLRGAPRGVDGATLLDRMRSQSEELSMPVPEAYDGVLSVPTTTTHFTTSL